ncbi:MAG: hypothetical protein M3O70_20920 [Actinomycetota bacterium]|nr:hypothetical protein [Actinomycetota bacterium]
MTTSAERLRVAVLGYIVRGPLGGLAWHHLQYVLGLSRLGHDVYFVEDSGAYPACYDPSRDTTDTDPTYGLRFADRLFGDLGLGDRWAYHDAHTGRWFGPCVDRIPTVCRTADLVLNLSAVNPLTSGLIAVPARALVDTDPVFTQIRHLTDPEARRLAEQHTTLFSFGENTAALPDDGFRWRPTRQPVVLDAWRVTPGPVAGRFTSVLQWDSYPPVHHDGMRYGMKADSFAPYLDLPEQAEAVLEVAVGSPTAPRELLGRNGWLLRDPLEVTRDPWTYQRYLRASKAEFGVAKHGYVAAGCGWFSERSAAYLASGRPVLVQDTGFSAWLPPGQGVLSFSTPEEAVAGIAEIVGRYSLHCAAGRAVAHEFFDSRTVLPKLLDVALQP